MITVVSKAGSVSPALCGADARALVGAQQGGAGHRGLLSGGEDVGHVGRACESARGDDGQRDGASDPGDQFRQRNGAGRCAGVNVAECPPAAEAWTMTTSTPIPAAHRASSAEVTVWTTP